MPLSGFIGAGDWGITERGVCTDKKARGETVLFLTPDMKAFQQAAKDNAAKLLAEGRDDTDLAGRTIVGKTFALTALKTTTAVSLVDPPNSDLRILSCNPDVFVPEGFKKEKALVEGCFLTDYVNSPDGQGSPHRGAVRDPSTEGAAKPGQPSTGSLGLPSAGSIAELKKLVSPHTVDCTSMKVTDEQVQSIDYMPVVDGPASAWGVKQRQRPRWQQADTSPGGRDRHCSTMGSSSRMPSATELPLSGRLPHGQGAPRAADGRPGPGPCRGGTAGSGPAMRLPALADDMPSRRRCGGGEPDPRCRHRG